jgi:hypothetical protein
LDSFQSKCLLSLAEIGPPEAKILRMKWFGPSALVEFIERGDELQVNVTGQRRGIDFVVSSAILSVFAFLFWRDRSWVYFVGFLIGCASGFRLWIGDAQEQLVVTEKGVDAISHFGIFSRDRVHLPWSAISGLEYQEGGEDETSGLYARTGGWSFTLLLTHVNKGQAEEIVTAIYREFPYVEMAEDSGGWLPLGGKSGLTTLGLSKPDHK